LDNAIDEIAAEQVMIYPPGISNSIWIKAVLYRAI
jgi:hypothetical protein